MDSFNAANTDAVVVKVSFNGDLRRFPFARGAPFQALREQVAAVLALEKGTELVLRYTDDEGDLITISSDWELTSAIKPGQLLRLTAVVKGSQAPAVQPSAPLPFPSVFGAPAPVDAEMVSVPPHPHFGGPGPFGGPAHADPFGGHVPPHPHPPAGPFGGPAPAGPFGGPGFGGPAAHGPFSHGPFGGPGHFGRPAGPHGGFAGGSAGWGGRGRFNKDEWKQLKKEHKSRFSPEEWAKLKEERKRMCKDRKKGGRSGGHPGYFGPHFGGHGSFGPHPHPHFGHSHSPHCGDAETAKLTARFVKDVSIADGAQIAAGALFVKTWRVRNEGEAWPVGCVLRLLTKHSDNMSSPETIPVSLEGPVGTGVEFDISVQLVAPAKPGRYTAYYKLCTAAGKKFGQRLWVSVVVPSNSSSSSEGEKEADKYESLVDSILSMGFDVKRHRVFRLLQKFDGDVAKVTELLQMKVQRKAQKEQKKANKHAK